MRWATDKVSDRVLANRLETTIICTQPPFTTMHSQHNAGAFLDRSEDIGALMPKARQLVELSGLVARLLPEPLTRCCYVANMRQGRLVLFAENSVVAARLKLLAPSLCNQLSEAGQQVNSIAIEVQPPVQAARTQVTARPAISARAAQMLSGLSDRLPDSPLKSALRRLAGRAEKA